MKICSGENTAGKHLGNCLEGTVVQLQDSDSYYMVVQQSIARQRPSRYALLMNLNSGARLQKVKDTRVTIYPDACLTVGEAS